MLGELVSNLQSDVSVNNSTISGTLNYVEGFTEFSSNPELQSGNYLALKFTAENWEDYTSVKVGLVPSAIGMDLVEIINDPDKNGVFRITNPETQKFVVEATNEEFGTVRKEYTLNLELENSMG